MYHHKRSLSAKVHHLGKCLTQASLKLCCLVYVVRFSAGTVSSVFVGLKKDCCCSWLTFSLAVGTLGSIDFVDDVPWREGFLLPSFEPLVLVSLGRCHKVA